ncbi:MAG: sugar phosphate isomerase/epimerase [Kiritimatiellae bacterium]|nr:sugar phosphate isomerase/epimerase [Kiritimatiellia bacterium]
MRDELRMGRRAFLARAAIASTATVAGAPVRPVWPPAVVLFSKVFQELKLDFETAAELTAQTGLDGVDCPVRPGGEIEPERAADELPRYAEALRRRGRRIGLLTTHIVRPDSPHAETVLRTAKELGIRWYRTGYWRVPKDAAPPDIEAIRAGLRELADLNRRLGVTAVIQNHSGGFVGGDLDEMARVLQGLNPDEVGFAFDLCHALITHGDGWAPRFQRLVSHVRVAYVKDTRLPREMVPLGQGELGRTHWFTCLKQLALEAPLSLHIEYDWARGAARTREALAEAIRSDLAVLKRWLASA